MPLDPDLIEASAIAIWQEFSRSDKAEWRWNNRVSAPAKEQFRKEARAVLAVVETHMRRQG